MPIPDPSAEDMEWMTDRALALCKQGVDREKAVTQAAHEGQQRAHEQADRERMASQAAVEQARRAAWTETERKPTLKASFGDLLRLRR